MNIISALGAYCFFENNPKALEGGITQRIQDNSLCIKS